MLLSCNNNAVSVINGSNFANEKELQSLCEQNLELLLNLEFIATEFTVANFRIDTLAYDKESNTFIIIEYKNAKITSVVDQGISYLSTMLNNKADFILKYSQKLNKIHQVSDINWEQAKVIFISPHFTQYQMSAINFQGLPIELWTVKKFDNNIISFDQINPTSTAAKFSEVIQIDSKDKGNVGNAGNVIKEIKIYSEDELLSVANEEIKELYSTIKEFILNGNEEITVKATKLYIGFYKNRSPLLSIKIYKKSLVIWINDKFENIDDPKSVTKNVTNIGHHGVGDCQIQITDDSNIGYIQDLIRKHLSTRG